MYEQRPHDFSSLYFREEENKMLRSGTKKCNICNKKYEEDQIESLWPCGHGYCIECLKYYMIYHLKKQLIIKCPELDCEQVVSKSTLLHQSYSNKKCLKSLLQKEKDKGKQCFICCKIEELQNLCPCQHKFCRLCLSQYLQYKIENQFTLIKCPKSECKQLMNTQSQVYQGLSESLKNRYSKIIQNIKIITSKSFKICPNCPETLLSEIKNETNLLCTSCFKKYCRICLNLAHRKFAKCDNAVVSILKYKLNFMRCSQCNFVVQKNQGCNHITCPCGYQFCYLCGKYWEGFMHQCPPKPIFIKPKPVEKKIIPPRQILAIPKKNVEFNLPFSPLIVKNKDIFPKKTTNLSFLFLNNRQKRTSSKSSRTPSTKNSSFYSVRAFEGLF